MTISTLLPDALRVGDPDVAGPLAVFPLLGGEPALEYLSFAEASALGTTVTELPGGASVNDLLFINPIDRPVLLYEGELLLGAQQDRTVDHAVLVPAWSKTRIAVSCVEAGRWDGSRHADAFSPAPDTAFPALRRLKSVAMRHAMAAGQEARAVQGEVWEAVAAKAQELHVDSPTDAMPDIARSRSEDLDGLCDAVVRRDGQVGAVACLAGAPTVVDLVSRADVFAALHGPLVRGYALDAAGATAVETVAAPSPSDVQRWLDSVLSGAPRRAATPGLGESVMVDGPAGGGTGLVVDDELVQLCAYATEPSARPATRVVRPSRRR